MECNSCIDHEDPRGHLIKHADSAYMLPGNLNETFARMLETTHPTLKYPPIPPQEPVPCIYGLAPPKPDYQICTHCHRGFKGARSDNTHPSPSFINHNCFGGEPNPSERSFFLSAVQTFTSQRKETNFPVITFTPTPPPATIWSSYETRMNSRPPPTELLSVPENYRVLHQFIHKEGWLAHVEGKQPHVLSPLVTIKRDDAQLPGLASHIYAYLEHYQLRLRSYHARRLISIRPR